MRFGVITFPGSNCDNDLIFSLRNNLCQDVVSLWHKDRDLQGADVVLLPGGFSYGDYLRSGAIARFAPVMEAVADHAQRGGYVVGICNGFQILTDTGLLPGALLHNITTRFICKNVFLKPVSRTARLSAHLEARAYKVPIAHGEGNFYCDADTLKGLEDNDQILFRYCDASGNITTEANPNGSLDNIAGICNAGKNVFGMMPHPERASDAMLGNIDGLAVLQGLLN